MTSTMFAEDAKPRLVEPVEIAHAILSLAGQGVKAESMLPELTRRYYVDLDAYNQVLRAA